MAAAHGDIFFPYHKVLGFFEYTLTIKRYFDKVVSLVK